MPKTKEIPWERRTEQLALNICDLSRIDDYVRRMLLGGKLDGGGPIRTDKYRPDEAAVLLSCDLLTAAMACDVIREHDRRAGEPVTRVYLKCVEAWQRLPADALLTVVEDDRVILNPEVFDEQVETVPLSDPVESGPVEF